jgi:Glycosyltransferase family 25 (LPS biosynthesis protein)
MSRIELTDLLVCIIAVEGKPRNNQLFEWVKKNIPEAEALIVEAITPLSLESVDSQFLREESSRILGRNVGVVEYCVMLSHRKCYEFLLNSVKKYLLVLEDDVVMGQSELPLDEIYVKLNAKYAAVVSIYSPSWSVWKNTKNGLVAKYPPPYAAAYFLNRDTACLAMSSKALGLADWPIWALGVRFYFQDCRGVSTLENVSYLDASRERDKANRPPRYSRILRILRKPELLLWKYQIWFPLIWKYYSFIRLLRTSSRSTDRIITRF